MNTRTYLALIVLVVGSAAGRPVSAQDARDGLGHLESGRLGQARAVFEALVARQPDEAAPHYYLGHFLLRTGQPDSAKALFDRAAALDAKAPLALVAQGEWAVYSGDLAAASAAFEQAVRRSKEKSPEVFHRIGLAYLRYETKDLDAAVDAFEKAVALDHDEATYHADLGDALLAKQKPGDAARAYEQALHFDPANARARHGLGTVSEVARQYTEATQHYQAAIEADAAYAPAHRALAGIYFLAKQYDRAAASFARYLELANGTPDDYFRYAGYLYLSGQYPASLDALRRAGDDYPNPVVHRLRAYNAYETQDYAGGLAHMERFLQAAPAADLIPSDHEYYGRLLLAAGRDTTAAIERFRQAIAADTAKSTLHRDIALALMSGRKYTEAAAEYEQLASRGVALSGTDYLNLGKAHYFAGDYPKADTAFAAVNAAAQSSALGWLWRARASARLDPESTEGRALPFYQKYVELTADTVKYRRELVEANFYLGYYYYLHEDRTLAKQYLDVVAALDPEHPHAQTLLDALAAVR